MSKDEPITVETTENSIIYQNGLTRVEILLHPFSFSLVNVPSGRKILDGCCFEVSFKEDVPGGSKKVLGAGDFTCAAHERVESLLPGQDGESALRVILASGAGIDASVEFDLVPGNSRLLLRVTITNKNAYPIHLQEIVPLAPCAGWETMFDGEKGELKVFHHGYQSWSLSRVFSIKDRDYHAALKIAQNPYHYRLLGFLDWLKRPRGRISSSGVTVVTNPSTGTSMTLGFVNFKRFHGELEVIGKPTSKRAKILGIRAVNYCDGIKLRTGDSASSMEFYIQDRNNYPRCLDEYADITASFMEPVFWSHIPFGYCTWYYYFHKIDEKETLKNLRFVTDPRRTLPFKIDYFQLDDGFQETQGQCGDWWDTHPEKFPRGLKPLMEEIRAGKLVAGLWIAPFNAAKHSNLAREHPDWLLKDARGKPASGCFISFRDQFSLDPTNPGVKEFLSKLFRYLVNDLGLGYIKIDFLYSAILDGARFFDEEVSRVEAYRGALQVLRETAGDDVFILGCGAPIMESIGMVNGMRISADTAPKWSMFDWLLSKLNIVVPGMKYALLNTITRSWMHKKFFINDPDCLLVRLKDSKLKPQEISTEISLMGLSGGQISISEDLEKLPSEKLRLISLVQPPYPVPAHSPDMFEKQFPEIFFVRGKSKSHGNWRVACLVNWKRGRRALAMDLSRIECDPSKKYHVFDFWTGKYKGIVLGNEVFTVDGIAGHGCALLRFTEVDPHDDCVLLGTTLHVLQGAAEIKHLALDEKKEIFSLEIEKPGYNTGDIFVKLAPRHLFKEPSGPGYSIVELEDDVYKIHVEFTDRLTLDASMERA